MKKVDNEVALAIFKPRQGLQELAGWDCRLDQLHVHNPIIDMSVVCPSCYDEVRMSLVFTWRDEWPNHNSLVQWREGFCRRCQKIIYGLPHETLLYHPPTLMYYEAVKDMLQQVSKSMGDQFFKQLPTREALAVHVETWLHKICAADPILWQNFQEHEPTIVEDLRHMVAAALHDDDEYLLMFHLRMKSWFEPILAT